jgi:argininosuccinate lyase
VRQAEEGGIELDQLPVEAFTAAHALFGTDARNALGVDASLAARNIDGGTGLDAVHRQLAQARASLAAADPSLGQ